ncbi:squamosa promoter-binding-like protein 12 [Phtheirospermum japonicum]|uniref:Squamosa promoter-binding-like protein 12 n=1 Tax=Phtheirospermum japonicum TaxID=374723 RepID=A0A830B7S7_9LAMI|nr:squamosa promoter-binding-like protein 12 [Phtheirospermum japonicum]
METTFGGKLHNFYGPEVGKKKISMEWDLNDWRWDGDLFMATPLNPAPSDCKSRQLFLMNPASNCSDEVIVVGSERENRDLEKRGRVEETGSLNLKLGGQVYPVIDEEGDDLQGHTGKKTKVACGAVSSRAVCQVDDCKVDLSSAKDYHRRHKVCDVHSKATTALVGNVMQRFCQQCSRFHVLKEFDEGKRSCRRRLAGHNKRRRKMHPENVVNTATQNGEHGSNYLLISLLRILSNIHSNRSDQSKDQDLLSHLLSNLANLAGTNNERNDAVSQGLQNVGPTLKDLTTPASQNASVSQSALLFPTNSIKEQASDPTVGRTKLNNIDLNDVYDGSQDCTEENLGNNMPAAAAGPSWLYQDSQRSSPPQTSGNSGSTSTSTSSGEAQSRTDRIVFKLFGKDPSDFPLVLRKQILDWLSNSPTDIESYIRPGCIILTIYLRMDKSNWEELYCDLASRLRRLLGSYTDPFWSNGWIYARVQNRVTFMCNGQVVLDTPLPVKHDRNCRISSIKPIAVTVSGSVQFSVKGFNLSRSTLRLLCTLEGNYLAQENCADSFAEHDELQSFSFSCVIPNTVGRGFIEIEDSGLSSSFFPFIVAEKDVCSEICTLETIFDDTNNELDEIRNQALEFIHEMGWLLHRARFKFRLLTETNGGSGDVELFSFQRFRWLAEFSIDHDWCAVVKKLLNILFDDDIATVNSKLVDVIGLLLLHRAVKRNCSSMVEFLLTYQHHHPGKVVVDGDHYYLFRPDAVGPGGLTPLHVAACLDSCDDVVDALTQDPGSVGIKAWRSARDSSGLTPHDYAYMRGHNSYNDLVQKKLNSTKSGDGHVVVDIVAGNSSIFEPKMGKSPSKFGALEIAIGGVACGQCTVKRLSYGKCSSSSSVRLYRPAMLSMVAIAAVCVCTALLFKSSPYVHPSLGPFRWELLKYGSQ